MQLNTNITFEWKIFQYKRIFFFYKYYCLDKDMRHQLGYKVGRKSLVSEEKVKFVTQLVICSDRVNEGMTTVCDIGTLKQIEPGINQTQAMNHDQRTFLP